MGFDQSVDITTNAEFLRILGQKAQELSAAHFVDDELKKEFWRDAFFDDDSLNFSSERKKGVLHPENFTKDFADFLNEFSKKFDPQASSNVRLLWLARLARLTSLVTQETCREVRMSPKISKKSCEKVHYHVGQVESVSKMFEAKILAVLEERGLREEHEAAWHGTKDTSKHVHRDAHKNLATYFYLKDGVVPPEYEEDEVPVLRGNAEIAEIVPNDHFDDKNLPAAA